ncbi:MAG: C40 family peptidase, partial [Bacteroidales bacterium]|nr:C40 family peptidase [Bacteroidales bacterium]
GRITIFGWVITWERNEYENDNFYALPNWNNLMADALCDYERVNSHGNVSQYWMQMLNQMAGSGGGHGGRMITGEVGDPNSSGSNHRGSQSGGSPVGGSTGETGAKSKGDETSYYDNALNFEGAPYKDGGMTKDGIDCSGLVNQATGNENRVWTTSMGDPPGNWELTTVRTDSYDNFIFDVQMGDLFLWPEKHTAFYAGVRNGKHSLFHAHGKTGTPTGYTGDLKTWWIPNRGYPYVYRQYIPIE